MHTLHHLSRAIEWVPNVKMPAIRRFYYYSSSMPKMEVVTLLAFSIVHVSRSGERTMAMKLISM